MSYLGIEALQSGMLTGGERPAAAFNAADFWLAIGYVSLQSFEWIHKDGQAMAITLVIIFITLGLNYQSITKLIKKPETGNAAGLTLFSSGLVYFAASLTLLYFFSFAEGIDQRFLGPGLLLAQMGLLAQFNPKRIKQSWVLGMAAVLAAANLPWRGLILLIGF